VPAGPAGRSGSAAGVEGLERVDQYVALGDSYTAGPLIGPTLPGVGCFRSLAGYPALLARALDVRRFVDVSCVGADTADLTGPQHTGLVRVPPQVAALSARSDLVTLGIGGNDFGVFGQLVGLCARLRTVDPGGAPCRDHYRESGEDVLLESLERTGDRVRRALQQVRRRAPRAQVLLVGYPRIVPVRGTCPRVLPFASGDYHYAATVQRRLNAHLRGAAARAGVGFVDTYRASRGHDACAGSAAWVNGRRLLPGRAQSYHPFASYMRAVTGLVLARLSA
jgi:lysophospholipase L1-like esterase